MRLSLGSSVYNIDFSHRIFSRRGEVYLVSVFVRVFGKNDPLTMFAGGVTLCPF